MLLLNKGFLLLNLTEKRKRRKRKMNLKEELKKLNETINFSMFVSAVKKSGKICTEVLTTLYRHLCWISKSLLEGLKTFLHEYELQKHRYQRSQQKMKNEQNTIQESK